MVVKEGFDVIVVGGGPAGSTVSTLMAQKGHRVLLLEKEKFPRYQIGESLLPATIEGICCLLGVRDEVVSYGFYPKNGGTFIWGKTSEPWSFRFDSSDIQPVLDDIYKNKEAKAFQVKRADFDNILIKNAAKKGVVVKAPALLKQVIFKDEHVDSVKYKFEGVEYNAKCRYLVDASGNHSTLYQHVGERVFSELFNNVAIYSYFDGGERLPEPDSGNILAVAFEKGWFWYIPLEPNLTSVGAVIGRNYYDQNKKSIKDFYFKLITECPVIKKYIGNSNLSKRDMYKHIRVRKDYSYTNTKLWKKGIVLIGDAACFVDPVFSSGVHLATYSALLAARSINSIFSGVLSEDEAFGEFEWRYRREFSNFYNFLVSFYDIEQNKEQYFWSAKKITNSKEKDNIAFINLVSGYSTDTLGANIRDSNYISRLSKLKNLFNESLPELVKENKECTSDEVSLQGFMKGFRQELVIIHAQSAGLNLEKKIGSIGKYVSSDDFLMWERVDG